MPASWDQYRTANASAALSIEARDPELVSLLKGTASATLRADALSNALSPVPPNEGQIKAEALKAEAQELFDKGRDEGLNLTEELRLAVLNAEALGVLKKQYQSKAATRAEMDEQLTNRETLELRVRSKNRFSRA